MGWINEGNAAAYAFLHRELPTTEMLSTVMSSPGVSLQDKQVLMGLVRDQAKPTGTTSLKDLLPAVAGAGLGALGAAMTAPVFGLSGTTKMMYGIGGAALGAVLNTLIPTGPVGQFPKWKA